MRLLILAFAASVVLGCSQRPPVDKPAEQSAQQAPQQPPPSKSMGVIAFHSNRSGSDQIYAINPDGTDLRVLTDKSDKAMFPKWSLNGDRLAYTVDREGTRISHFDLYNPDSRLLWVGFAFKEPAFSWSPDGRALVYHGALKPFQQNDIYIYGPNHSELTPITSNAGRNESPAWSPDGRQIAFQTDRDGNWDIYLMNVDGSGPVNLTRNGSADRLPSWSPDGRMLAFTSASWRRARALTSMIMSGEVRL